MLIFSTFWLTYAIIVSIKTGKNTSRLQRVKPTRVVQIESLRTASGAGQFSLKIYRASIGRAAVDQSDMLEMDGSKTS